MSAAEHTRDDAHRAREVADAERSELGRMVAEQRDAVANVERDIAVADADQRSAVDRRRRAEAERQLESVAGERGNEEFASVRRDRDAADAAVAAAEAALADRSAAEDTARTAVGLARASLERAEQEVRSSREALHRLELDRDGAEAREQNEIGARLSQLLGELPPLQEHLSAAASGVSVAQAAATRARDMASAADAAFGAARDATAGARDHETATRAALRDADDTLMALEDPHALEQLERERVGLAPAAARLLKERARFGDGAIVGPISDFVGAAPTPRRSLNASWARRYTA